MPAFLQSFIEAEHGLYLIIDMELSQSCRKEIKAGREHLLYPDSRMVVIRFMACAL